MRRELTRFPAPLDAEAPTVVSVLVDPSAEWKWLHPLDGIVIYLDGKEVARDNMSEGEEAYDLPAASAVSDDAETTTYRIPLGDDTLAPGAHVLAISLHNPARPSSDLRIGGITLVEVEAPEAP